MKKTLIAMFALAGVAMADTVDKDILTIPDSISRLSDSGSHPGWSELIGRDTINAEAVTADLKHTTVTMPNGWSWGISNLITDSQYDSDVTTEATFQAFEFKGRSGYGGEFVAGIVDVADLVSSTTNATGISALTFNFQTPQTQSNTTFSVWHWDGEATSTATALVDPTKDLTTALTGNSFSWEGEELTKGKILVVFGCNNGGGAVSSVAKWNATATLNIASVPEPATATLSLLALAGLAARRRRH